jgi:GNAT superfamily N-acetyltransferase
MQPNMNIIPIGYEYKYSGTYQFTATHEPDADYRCYLARRLRDVKPFAPETHSCEAYPVDISMDDVDGDVAAGISAVIDRDVLIIDMLWVDEAMRGQGIGRRLVQMVEDIAIERDCYRVRVRATDAVAFFVDQGYAITGTIQAVPSAQEMEDGKIVGQAVYWLVKDF